MQNQGQLNLLTVPVFLMKKKDETTPFCVDYRWLNDVAKKDSYPLPGIDGILNTQKRENFFILETTAVCLNRGWRRRNNVTTALLLHDTQLLDASFLDFRMLIV